MDLLSKLPTMTDEALSNLGANAARLEKSGTAATRASAATLLPAIEAELAARKEAKRERMAQARRDAPKRRATTKAKAAPKKAAPKKAAVEKAEPQEAS